MKPDAIFVSYNSEAHFDQQDPAVLAKAFGEVIVVDNGSTDGSVEVAKASGYRTVALGGNRGYAAAVNVGVRQSSSRDVVVMNPDVIIDSAADVDRLMQQFEDPEVGLVAPGLLLPTGERQDSARRMPAPWELVARRLSGVQHGRINADTPRPVDWVVGAFLGLRRKAFDAVGGLDERYRFYFEDVDLCVRLWSAGWKVVYDPTVIVRHEHGAASRRSLLGWPMRQHIRGATRFYRRYPHFAVPATGRFRRQPDRELAIRLQDG